jgi:hypothetical protein
MRSLAVALVSFFGIFSCQNAAWAEEANTRTAPLPYAECLSIIVEVSQETGEPPVRLIDSEEETAVRINASDGFVTVSCLRTENKMVLTKSPVSNAAGITAAR